MAATTLALGVNMLAFIPMFGLSMAVGVLVGQRLTSGEPDLARRTVRSGLSIGIFYSLCFAVAYGFFPDRVLSVYSIGSDPERFQAMRPIVTPILWFVAAYCIFDAIQIVFVGALKGAGDTRYVLLGSILSGVVTVDHRQSRRRSDRRWVVLVVGSDHCLGDLVSNSLLASIPARWLARQTRHRTGTALSLQGSQRRFGNTAIAICFLVDHSL